MKKITVEVEFTKESLKEMQEFVEVHEYKLLGMLDTLRSEGIITKETCDTMRSHIGDITNYAASLYWKLHHIAPNADIK